MSLPDRSGIRQGTVGLVSCRILRKDRSLFYRHTALKTFSFVGDGNDRFSFADSGDFARACYFGNPAVTAFIFNPETEAQPFQIKMSALFHAQGKAFFVWFAYLDQAADFFSALSAQCGGDHRFTAFSGADITALRDGRHEGDRAFAGCDGS